MAEVTYIDGTLDRFSTTQQPTLVFNLINSDLDFTEFPGAVVVVALICRVGEETVIDGPEEISIGDSLAEFRWQVTAAYGSDGNNHVVLAAIAVPEGGFSVAQVQVSWPELPTSGRSIKACASAIFNVEVTGTDEPVQCVADSISGITDVIGYFSPEAGWMSFGCSLQFTGNVSHDPGLSSDAAGDEAYTMTGVGVALDEATYYETGYYVWGASEDNAQMFAYVPQGPINPLKLNPGVMLLFASMGEPAPSESFVAHLIDDEYVPRLVLANRVSGETAFLSECEREVKLPAKPAPVAPPSGRVK